MFAAPICIISDNTGCQNGTRKWAVGGITHAKTQTDFLFQNGNFKVEHTAAVALLSENLSIST